MEVEVKHGSLRPPSNFPPAAHLLMVLNAHAERVDQDGDHDAPVEVLALHDPLQLLPEAHKGAHYSVAVVAGSAPPAAPSPASQIPDLVIQEGLTQW